MKPPPEVVGEALDSTDTRSGTASPEGADEPRPVAPDRLVTLADGVFAIAMTLLVLELAVPAVTNGDLATELREMWPEFLMYALGFLVLGVYWVIHHMIYDSISRYDTTLAWLNIVYLMFAALIPFSTALVVENDPATSSTVFYGVNMLVLFVLGWGMWAYATARHRLVGGDIDEEIVRGGRRMGYVYVGVLTASLAVAFLSPVASLLTYGGVVLVFIAFTSAGRWQTVSIWSGFPGSRRRRV